MASDLKSNQPDYLRDFFRPDTLADPYPLFERMRTEAPIHWSEAWGYWVLTRYSEVMATLRDPRLSHYQRITTYINQLPDEAREELQPICKHYASWLGFMDPPEHTRLRPLVAKAFTPKMVESLRPRIQSTVSDLLGAVRETGRMDIIQDFAYPLPLIVIAEMFGLPSADRPKFRKWANDMVAFIGTGRAVVEVARQSQASLLEMTDYVRHFVHKRRQEPQDDLLSALIAVEERGDGLNEAELVGTCVSFTIAGHETTTNTITLGIRALLNHPDQLQQVRDNPSGIATAVEELLRYDGPVQRHWGVATEPLDVAGQRIEAGEVVVQLLGAANRDPAQFPEPDRLDVTRRENRHVSFGYGPRFCIGAPLARVEAQIALLALAQELPGLALVDEPLEWHANMAFRGPKALPVVFN